MAGSKKSLTFDNADETLAAIKGVLRQSHAAAVLVLATRLELRLEELLKAQMPNLSNTLSERLFEGFGPFASFSAKIDVTFAMGLIPSQVRSDLHAIRGIRNAFAHTHETLSFDHPDIIKRFEKLSAPNGISETRIDRFQAVYKSCRKEILASIAHHSRENKDGAG